MTAFASPSALSSLHLRLLPSSAGAFVDALNAARADGSRILGKTFAPFGPVTLCCISIGDSMVPPAGQQAAVPQGPLVLRLVRPPPTPPPQAAAVAFDTSRLSLLPFFAPTLPPSPPLPASPPPPAPTASPPPAPLPALIQERPDIVPIKPARAPGPAPGPADPRAGPGPVAPGAALATPPGSVPLGTAGAATGLAGATTGLAGATGALAVTTPSPSPTATPSPTPTPSPSPVIASPPPPLPPPVLLLDRPVPAVPTPVPTAAAGPPLGGQPQPQAPLGGLPAGQTPGFVVPGGTAPGQQQQVPKPNVPVPGTTPSATLQTPGGVDTSKCSLSVIQSNFQAILVALAPCLSEASDACCQSVVKLVGPAGTYPNCLCEPSVFKGITTLDVSAVIPGVKVDILARLNACKAKNAAPPFIGGAGCAL